MIVKLRVPVCALVAASAGLLSASAQAQALSADPAQKKLPSYQNQTKLPKIAAAQLGRGTAFFTRNNPVPMATAANACDLNQDGAVNVVDVQMAIDMYLGTMACTDTVEGPGVCNQDVITRIKAAALGGACVTGPGPHSVTLNWTASTTPNIGGYNLYRSATPGGPYSKVTTSLVTATSYVDYNVDAGLTYYYVATAVDASNNESGYSNQAIAAVPTP